MPAKPDISLGGKYSTKVYSMDAVPSVTQLLGQWDFGESGVEIVVKPMTKDQFRSVEQNRLQYRWYGDLEKQGDQTAQEYRAYSKAFFGIPILLAEDEEFRDSYNKTVKPLSYEIKMALMLEPIALPITSRMNTDQMSRYLNAMSKHFSTQGFRLTSKEDYMTYKEAS
tara:strand:+ start:15660 stop:16163 length:504 start_codon:yes stop_codon:yes gene_type:complete